MKDPKTRIFKDLDEDPHKDPHEDSEVSLKSLKDFHQGTRRRRVDTTLDAKRSVTVRARLINSCSSNSELLLEEAIRNPD